MFLPEKENQNKWMFQIQKIKVRTTRKVLLRKESVLLNQCTCVIPKRFNLTRDMTNLYPFIQGSLESPFRELFSVNVSLWNQRVFM